MTQKTVAIKKMDSDVWHRMKVYALQHNLNVNEAIASAINYFLGPDTA